jgi:hypothetical protein
MSLPTLAAPVPAELHHWLAGAPMDGITAIQTDSYSVRYPTYYIVHMPAPFNKYCLWTSVFLARGYAAGSKTQLWPLFTMHFPLVCKAESIIRGNGFVFTCFDREGKVMLRATELSVPEVLDAQSLRAKADDGRAMLKRKRFKLTP